MFARLLTGLLLLPAAAAAQAPGDHPYRDARVGDYAKYKHTLQLGGQAAVEDVLTLTVTAATDREVTTRVEAHRDGKQILSFEKKYDLTRPYDPLAAFDPEVAPVTKQKEGKARVRAGGRDYETTWATYRAVGQGKAAGLTAEITWWTAPGVPGGIVKMEAVTVAGGKKSSQTQELIETGRGPAK